jgi:uncharacterized protein (TIGR01777 family)
MNLLLTGASGLIGSALVAALESEGHHVTKLRRAGRGGPTWDPAAHAIDLSSAPSPDAVVHLAGENVGARWTPERKRRIRESRIGGTRLLCETLAQLPVPPRALVCASATGFYGDRADEWLDETSPPGAGFLAGVCRDWEAATASAKSAGIRVVQVRLGIVLAGQGGALAKMLPAFRLGLGGRLGDGRQFWSWIALADVVRAVEHALGNPDLHGPVNVTSPNPVTNREFTAGLGRVLRRPACFAVPRLAVNLLFGEMGREALLASARVRPARLLGGGFQFRFPDLEAALRSALADSCAPRLQ